MTSREVNGVPDSERESAARGVE